MQKMERRFSKTLLKISKKFLSLEENIKNISCEGTVSSCKIPSLSDASFKKLLYCSDDGFFLKVKKI